MASGKFSKPRTPKREDQELEQAFRQVTGAKVTTASKYDNSTPKDDQPSNSERNKKIIAISLCTVAIALLVFIFVTIGMVLKENTSEDKGLILNNVSIGGINVGGMSPAQAADALHRATDLTFSVEDMVIQLPDTTIRLSPQDTGAKLNVDAAVEAAYNYGRVGTDAEKQQAKAQTLVGVHNIALLPYLELNTAYIRQVLNDYSASLDSSYTPSTYVLEGDVPALEGELFNEDAPCQILVLTTGTPGQHLDMDEVYNDVLDAYSFNNFLVTVESLSTSDLPKDLNLDAIYEEYCTEPVDAVMNMETFEVTYETYGYTFDLEAARELLATAEYGETLEIPMTYLIPEVLGKDLAEMLYRDVLGSCNTPHTGDANRNTNLKLACKAINGYVLYPGDVFDYNKVVGQRTTAAGYKPAGAYSNGETVEEVGGGICQVSSTLYYCALLADLDIVTRQNHSYISSYIDPGMDATVSWGGPEFRFRNSTNYPIRITAEVSGGYVRIQLIGTDEKDYYVEMKYKIVSTKAFDKTTQEFEFDNEKGYKDGDIVQAGVDGKTVKSYKCKYDKQTGKLLSETLEATSTYTSKDEIKAVVKPEPTEPSTEPTEEPTEPSEEPTEPSVEATEPSTEATEPSEEVTEPPTEAPTEPSAEASTGGESTEP